MRRFHLLALFLLALAMASAPAAHPQGRIHSTRQFGFGQIHDIAVLPGGERVVVAGHNAVILDLNTGAMQQFFGVMGSIPDVALSPDGSLVFTADQFMPFSVWDVATGKPQHTIFNQGGVSAAAFTADGRFLAYGGSDGRVELMDLESGYPVRVWESGDEGHWSMGGVAPYYRTHKQGAPVQSISFTSDGNTIIITAWDGTTIWDLKPSRRQAIPKAFGKTAVLLPDDQRLAVGHAHGFCIWDIPSATVTAWVPQNLEGVNHLALSDDGTRILACTDRTGASLWDVSTLERLSVFEHPTSVVRGAFLPGDRILTAGGDGRLRLWDVATGECGRTYPELTLPVGTVAFNPTGTQILTANGLAETLLWDRYGGTVQRKFPGGTFALSPDGDRLVTAGEDGAVRVWDPASGARIASMTADNPFLHAVAFSPDGAHVATAGFGTSVCLWDAGSGALLKELHEQDSVYAIAFSPEGHHLLTSSRMRTPEVEHLVTLWDIRTGEALTAIGLGPSPAYAVEFSPDGNTILTAGADGIARLWNRKTCALLREYIHEEGAVIHSAAFSPDGQLLVTACAEGVAIVRDIETGDVRWTLFSDLGTTVEDLRGRLALLSVTFAPDGRAVLAGSLARCAMLWSIEPESAWLMY